MLWPAAGTEHGQLLLAITGAMPDTNTDVELLARKAFALLRPRYADLISERYKLSSADWEEYEQMLEMYSADPRMDAAAMATDLLLPARLCGGAVCVRAVRPTHHVLP